MSYLLRKLLGHTNDEEAAVEKTTGAAAADDDVDPQPTVGPMTLPMTNGTP
jgi:hypothetical protein